ncbi:MAG TPA: DUF3347 domain-containing protein [Patescibacteria group bacterium]|nr:DUF3347 domain-containing protein [Patescibacteria group bacterium]
MFKKSSLFGIVLSGAFVFAACTQQQETAENRTQGTHQTGTAHQNASGSGNFHATWNQYLEVKDALVALQATDVQREARELVDEIKEVKNFDGAADKLQKWGGFAPKFTEAANAVASASDLATQKTAFEKLSAVMEEGVRTFGLHGATAYKQHCPMAFDNKGASWLSDEKEIENPYEAETMKSCGSVQEEIKM